MSAQEPQRNDPDGPLRRPHPPGTIRIGQIAGTDVLITTSWFLVAGLISWVMGPAVEAARPGLGGWKYLAGFAFAIVLYLAVLVHEAAHAIAAKRYGHPVDSITLHFLGGATAIEGEARNPREEFVIAVVGPIASILVGLAAGVLWLVMPEGLIKLALGGLLFANLLVGALNLVPGLPLDGGRVLKAGVWRITGNPHRGTIAAGWGGRITAVLVLFWPAIQERWTGQQPELVDYVLTFVIALFLWTGATAAMQSARIRRRLPSLVARDRARRTLTVPDNLPVAEAVRRAQEAHAGSIVTVSSSGVPIGIVNEAALLALPEERRPWLTVSAVARTIEDGLTLPVTIVGEELIKAITRKPAQEYLLLEEDGSIYGVLATADVDRAFSQRGH